MNICIITSSFPANQHDARAAAGLFVKDFAVALHDLGHFVSVFTPQKNVNPKENIEGIKTNWFSWMGGKKRLSYMKPYNPVDAISMVSLFRQGWQKLRKFHKEEQFDFVIAMWAVPAGLLAKKLYLKYNVPYIVWCLGSDIWTYGKYPILKNIVADVLKRGRNIYADGVALADDAEKLCGRNCAFLPSARDVKEKTVQNKKTKSEHYTFLFIGRYAKVKGVDILIEAFAKFVELGHHAQLIMVGGGPMEKIINRRIKEVRLNEFVSVEGYADLDKVISYIHNCNTVLIPSRMESVPLVLSDTVQLGKSVIVTDVGDMGKLVSEYRAGYVVKSEDPVALCDAMVKSFSQTKNEFSEGVDKLSALFDLKSSAVKIVNEAQIRI